VRVDVYAPKMTVRRADNTRVRQIVSLSNNNHRQTDRRQTDRGSRLSELADVRVVAWQTACHTLSRVSTSDLYR